MAIETKRRMFGDVTVYDHIDISYGICKDRVLYVRNNVDEARTRMREMCNKYDLDFTEIMKDKGFRVNVKEFNSYADMYSHVTTKFKCKSASYIVKGKFVIVKIKLIDGAEKILVYIIKY